MKLIQVNNCRECPWVFHHERDYICGGDKDARATLCEHTTLGRLEDIEDDNTIPDWCPLAMDADVSWSVVARHYVDEEGKIRTEFKEPTVEPGTFKSFYDAEKGKEPLYHLIHQSVIPGEGLIIQILKKAGEKDA